VGTYVVDNIIIPAGKHGITLEGESRDGTILVGTSGDLITLSDLDSLPDHAKPTRAVTIKNLTLDGKNKADNGINASWMYESKFENIVARRFRNAGIYAGENWIANVVERYKTDGNGVGLYIGKDCNANTVRNSRISANVAGIGIHLRGNNSFANSIIGNVIESNSIGIRLEAAGNNQPLIVVRIVGNYLDNHHRDPENDNIDVISIGTAKTPIRGLEFSNNWVAGSGPSRWLHIEHTDPSNIENNVNSAWCAYRDEASQENMHVFHNQLICWISDYSSEFCSVNIDNPCCRCNLTP
jgi:hypothetical protein